MIFEIVGDDEGVNPYIRIEADNNRTTIVESRPLDAPNTV